MGGNMAVELTKNSIDLGIVTQNAEAALKFYRDTLGFVHQGNWDMPGGHKMYRLLCGESIIKIVQLKDAPPAQAPPGGIEGATGYRYWTMSISNLSSVVEACRDGGYTVVVPEFEVAPGAKIAIVEDPDGNWIELLSGIHIVEPPPKEA
jgi:catechol 2,3-dioxygenase-like lactoylglutathione lyase family enzyme